MPTSQRQLAALRHLFTLATASICVKLTAYPGMRGCFVPQAERLKVSPLFDVLVGVPVCNGAIGYLLVAAVALVTYRSLASAAYAAMLCAVLEVAYRELMHPDPNLSIVMPAWKLCSAVAGILAFGAAVFLLRVGRRFVLRQDVRNCHNR
jgi:hypothetical protein